jgi:hypothetical protein
VDPTTRAGHVDPPTIMIHLALGTAAVAWQASAPLWSAYIAAVRGVGAAVSTVAPGVTALVCRGRSARDTLERLADAGLRLAVRRVVGALLSTVDLTELVRAHVDLDTVAAGLDVDAVVARADLDAAVARIDLEGLARQVIDAVDLPEIVRRSTGSLTSETVRSARTEAMHADDAVTGLVDRLLRRPRASAHSPMVP